jgi:transcriptional regulator with XRE-family HTH domain
MDTMRTSKEIIGIMIKRRREEKKITQQELAYLLDVNRQYMWRLENGKVNLTMDYLDKLILHLDCKHSDFLIDP